MQDDLKNFITPLKDFSRSKSDETVMNIIRYNKFSKLEGKELWWSTLFKMLTAF